MSERTDLAGHVPALESGASIPYRVITQSRLARFVAWLRRDPNMGGITIWSTIRFVDDASAVPQLITHESRHVAQWHHFGPVGFARRYLMQSVRHGYRGNAFELDAMQYAGQLSGPMAQTDWLAQVS